MAHERDVRIDSQRIRPRQGATHGDAQIVEGAGPAATGVADAAVLKRQHHVALVPQCRRKRARVVDAMALSQQPP